MKTLLVKKQVAGFKCMAKIRLSPTCTASEIHAIRAHMEETARCLVFGVTGVIVPRTKWNKEEPK